MITKLDKETLNFISEKRLSFGQFCICLLLHHKDVAGIIQYTDRIGLIGSGKIKRPDGTEVIEIEDLVKRGFLKHCGIDSTNYWALDNFAVTEKFTAGFLLTGEDMAKEFWDEYLPLLNIQNKEVPAKSVDFKEFVAKYNEVVKGDIKLHKDIIARYKHYKSMNRYANMGIMKWVGAKAWESINLEQGGEKIRLY